MKEITKILYIAILLLATSNRVKAQTPVSYFGAIPDLKVDGKEIVAKKPDGTWKAVTLHGVMDTPNAYFNGWRWTNGNTWADYNSEQSVEAVKKYFTKVFQAIANPKKRTYCNLFRLHLDPAWLKDNTIKASGFTNINDDAKTATDPNGHTVFDEANICHFSFDKMRTRMYDLYEPIIKDALAHGLYVVVRPPGVFPEDVTVGDYYNTYLTTVWDIVSSNDYIKSHAGQIMLELGNEPVRMTGNLADYFQPIVDKIRENGFTGIILLPGTNYQANYTNYATNPISDTNYGYAVHNYPGWYGGWDANQTEANFISTFETQVSVVNDKPIVITEVDWSPMKEGAGHWNEMHTQYTEGNFGTWGTGTTNSPAPNVPYKNTQNTGWGMRFKHLVDKHPNISWTLQGTSTLVDMDKYLRKAIVEPAFKDAMIAAGYSDAKEACSETCMEWFKEYACGNRIPEGTPNVAPEVITYYTSATTSGTAKYDDVTSRYYFPNTWGCAFIFNEFSGTKLSEAGKLLIKLGEGTVGYRLDVQLKDKDQNGKDQIIKIPYPTAENPNATQDYILGTQESGTRLATFDEAKNAVYDLQSLFASYLTEYPNCTIGSIRINTATPQDNETAYWFTIDDMVLDKGTLVARTPQEYVETNLADIKMYRHTPKYIFNNPENLGGWCKDGSGATIKFENNAGKDGGSGYLYDNSSTGLNAWDNQFNIQYDAGYNNGTEYILSLDIKGKVAGSIGAAIQNPDGYKDCGNFPSIDVTTEWKNVTVKTIVTGDNAKRILLNLGAYVGTINIDNIQVYTRQGETVSEVTGTNIKLNESTGEAFGAGLLGNVSWTEYADLTDYKKMVLKGSGTVRVLYNRPEGNGTCPEIRPEFKNGTAEIDLTEYPYFHLNSIKAPWNETINLSSISLTNGANAGEVADYYISGAGHEEPSVAAALADEHATVIDITGYSGKLENMFTSANPNCLLIYNQGTNVGSVYGDRNMVKSTDNSSFKIDLVDGHDFRAPFNISTFERATYSRDLSTEWATICLPFKLDISQTTDADIYLLEGFSDDNIKFKKAAIENVDAGSIILYHNAKKGTTVLKGKNIAKTADGFNIQPVANSSNWFTAQCFKEQDIEDVSTDPILKDYDVYGISGDKFVHVGEGVGVHLKPFRTFYLKKKSNNAAKASLAIYISEDNEATGVNEVTIKPAPTVKEIYDSEGRLIPTMKAGLNIMRMSDGTVRKVMK